MRTSYAISIVASAALLFSACPARKDGAIEGTVVPPSPGVRVAALHNGITLVAREADPATGGFRLPLPPGTYDVQVSTSSPFPLAFPGVTVRPGETTTLPPISLAPAPGTGTISGSVRPAGGSTTVTLYYAGKERAAVRTDAAGRYAFAGLPAGSYTVMVSAPGYAADRLDVPLTEGRTAAHEARLFYVTAVEGVDWDTGVVRATGIGRFPKSSPNRTIAREMAKRAALSDARRKLAARLSGIRVDPDRTLSDALGTSFTVRIEGFVRGSRIVAERDRSDGVEVDVEAPLTGTDGLSSAIRDFRF